MMQIEMGPTRQRALVHTRSGTDLFLEISTVEITNGEFDDLRPRSGNLPENSPPGGASRRR